MINLLCLLCSMCIQFVAFGIPYEMNYDDFTLGLMQTFEVQAQGSEDPKILYFADMWKTGEVQYFLFNGDNGNYEIWYDASKYNSSYTSSVVGRIEDNTNSYLQLQLKFNRYYRIVFNPNYTSTLSCSFPNDYGWDDYIFCRVYPYTQDSYKYLYMVNGVVNNESGSPIIYGNYIFNEHVDPETPTLGNLGSLDSSGHTSGSDPLETLNNFSWSGHSSSYIQTGHNTHVNSSNATPDFTNATQNLLGQIVDNTNSIISNTNSLGGVLETINGNIINGASAIFNAVSQLNSNFVSSVIIDKEELNDQWTASNTYLAFASMQNSFNLLQSTADDLIDRYSATEDVDELIIPIDLTVWQINSSVFGNFKPFDEVYYMRFGFLDETKALWQPLFIALLYFCLFYGIVLDLPNIIRGVKS